MYFNLIENCYGRNLIAITQLLTARLNAFEICHFQITNYIRKTTGIALLVYTIKYL